MEKPKFWIDFDNGDLCRADGTAIACMKADHCDPTPESIEELDKILKDAPRLKEQAAALQNERDVLKSLLADNLSAWDGEEDSVKEEHSALIEETREAVDGKE